MIAERPLADLVVDEGFIGRDELDRILGRREDATEPVGDLLVRLGLLTEKQKTYCIGKQLGVPFIDLSAVDLDTSIARALPHAVAIRLMAVAFDKSADGYSVAMANPLDIAALDDLQARLGAPVEPYIASEEDIRDAIFRTFGAYDDLGEIVGEAVKGLDTAEIEIADEETEDGHVNVVELKEVAEGAPVVKLVNAIFARAIAVRASDIHIEPHPRRVRVRYRIDGILQEAMVLPKDLQQPLASRIKVMGAMDIAERRAPQDGRCTLVTPQGEFDFRISTYPSVNGENIVLRILDKKAAMIGMDRLGLNPEVHAKVERHIAAPSGMILATGPTGSGKTTTLYAALNALNTVERNVMTIEDPVEYQLTGVVQGNVNPRAGITFANGLRAILRQDPDVLLVGEIRDTETAEIAIEAALTGHLVLSSLHANDAAGAVSRLVDMGIEPFLVASAVNLVLAQRLLRVTCQRCKMPHRPSDLLLHQLGLPLEHAYEQGLGCDYCARTGYMGRCGAYEALEVTPPIQNLIMQKCAPGQIRDAAIASGMTTLREDALAKVLSGITTPDEVARATLE
ncbi:MAG: type II/IV secretion system protein [Fimbriimonadia bacterium]|jgi:type IV pilus assembly protein PilB